MHLSDKFGRTITDLRISITDRCNYKCVYCRTGNDGATYADLSFPEYLRIARLFASLGIKKVRITGGEPRLSKLTVLRVILDGLSPLLSMRTSPISKPGSSLGTVLSKFGLARLWEFEKPQILAKRASCRALGVPRGWVEALGRANGCPN
jgi:MoaA/NifB/PqqE/SkfB family radical SAM enzyme